MTEFEPIWSSEAEQATLGAMMLSEKACGECSYLNREMFYGPYHRMIYDALEYLYLNGKPIDLVTVKDWLNDKDLLGEVGGTNYLVQVSECCVTTKNATYYADIVRDKWALRELEKRLDSCKESLRDNNKEVAEKIEVASSLVQGLLDSSTLEFRVADIVHSLSDSTKPGLPTGISAVDDHSDVGGLYPDEPNIVSALTGVGKSVFGLNLAKKWCRAEKRVLFVSLELKADKIVRRLMKMLCGFGDLDRAERAGARADWDAAANEIAGWDLTIYDPSKTRGGTKDVETVCEWVIAKHERKPVDAVIMDYAQFFKSRQKSDGKTRLMEHVEEELRTLNARCGFVLVLLAQLIQERTKDGKVYHAIRNSREFGLGAAYDLRIIEDFDPQTKRAIGYKMFCEKNRSGRNYWSHDLHFDQDYLQFSSHPSTSMR